MRRTKTTQANIACHRKFPTRRLIMVWTVFLVFASAVFLWAGSENQRVVSQYQQSTYCDTPRQQDCREVLDAVVNQTSIYNTGSLPVRGSPAIGSDIGVQIELTMPDEGTEIIRVSRDTATWQKGDENQQYVWFSLGKPFGMKTGDVVSITRWKNKIIKVETRDDLVILTADHPENQGIVRNPLLWSIFGMLLIAVLIWTCYEILRKPR